MKLNGKFSCLALLCSLMACSGAPSRGADVALSGISFPPGNYQDFAKTENKTPGFEIPPAELQILETTNDFQKVTLPSEAIKIKIPLGWEIYIKGKYIVFGTPAGDIQGNIGWYPIAPKDFKTFQRYVIQINQEEYAAQIKDNPILKLSAFQLPKGFGVQWANLWAPYPKGGTLADFAATPPEDISRIAVFFESANAPEKVVRLFLVSKTNQIDPLLKLMGLMVRDVEF